MTWNHDYDRRKAAWTRPRDGEPEEPWIEEARELLLRAAEGGMFREVFRYWRDGQRSPLVAARASELLDRQIEPADVKAFGVFDRHRNGWAARFWKAIDASRIAAEKEEGGA